MSHDDPRRGVWQIRAHSYRAFLDRVLVPLELSRGRPLTILDLGAGNCWLAHRLAARGHKVLAIDLSADPLDGLGAFVWYERDGQRGSAAEPGAGARSHFVPIQAEFDRLPLASGQVDLAIFNGSLHYSTDYPTTLREALRVLRADGRIVIFDSPFYTDPRSGAAMVREREGYFATTYGFKGDQLPTEGFLTLDRLGNLGAALDLRWQVEETRPRWRAGLSRWRSRMRGRREPRCFPWLLADSDARPRREPPGRNSPERWRGCFCARGADYCSAGATTV